MRVVVAHRLAVQIFDFMANDTPWQKEAAAATAAMLVGRVG